MYKYSLLCPSYGRPEMLSNCIDSLKASCSVDLSDVQMIIKIDDDDSRADGYYQLKEKYNFAIKVLQAPQRGYFDLASAWNLMYKHVESPVVWVLNDDITIKGNWCAGLDKFNDISTGHYRDGIVIGSFQHRPNFPVVRYDFCQKIGMLSPVFGVDGFLTTIARMYRRLVILAQFAQITHVHPDPRLVTDSKFIKRSQYLPPTTKGLDYDINVFGDIIRKCDEFYIKAPNHDLLHRTYKSKFRWKPCERIRAAMKKK